MVQKRTLYEWSTRVPLIIRFPQEQQRGTVRAEPVNLIDLLPTFLDMAGVAAEERLPMDGRSLMGLLDGSDTEDWEAISEYHSQGAHAPCFMIRRGKYKYVYHTPPDAAHPAERELYDLSADPGEFNNLAAESEHGDRIAAMHTLLSGELGQDPDEAEQRCRADYAAGYSRD